MNKNIQNISTNYMTCPLCKNIFLKSHVKIHYTSCKKRYEQKERQDKEKQDKEKNTQNTDYIRPIQKKKIIQQNNHSFLHQNEVQQLPALQLDNYIKPELVSYNDSVLNHFFKEYDKLFSQFVSGKCVALVGPAQSVLGTGKGAVIDKFDLVVRLNKSIPLPSNLKDDIGTKTNIIYNSLNTSDFPGQNNLNPKLYKKYGVNFVCSSYPFNHKIFHDDIANYVYKYKFDLPLKVMGDLKFRNFENMLGTRPYTGTCAIMDLLSYPIKYLYITGLDFYQTKYYSEYRKISKETLKYNKNSRIHQCEPQLEYLKNISLTDSRIILDNFLDKLLYHDYYKVTKNLLAFDKANIYNFGDTFFQKYFEMKISSCTFTKNNCINNYGSNNGNAPYLVFTDNKTYSKNNNEYCLFITHDKNYLNMLNNNLESKKFIGNFYLNENKNNRASIYLTSNFLNFIKSLFIRINISNCNVNLAILLSILIYLPDKHFFSYNEIFNYWSLNNDEKKFVLFLLKKKIVNLM